MAEPSQPLWTPELTKELMSAPQSEQDKILDTLSPDELDELDVAVKGLSASGPVDYSKGAPMLKSAGVQPPAQQSEAQAVQPYYNMIPATGVPEQTFGQKVKSVYDDTLGPAITSFGKWQEQNVTPVVKAGQKAIRESAGVGGAGPFEPFVRASEVIEGGFVKALGGDDRQVESAKLAQRDITERAVSLFIGSPESRLAPEELDARAKAVTDLPSNVGMGDQPLLSGAMQSVPTEMSYLPLYLIDAPARAGRLANAAVGGGLSELLDPREGSNALRGTLLAGGLGLTIEGVIKGVSKVASTVDAARASAFFKRPGTKLDGVDAEAAVLPAESLQSIEATVPGKVTKPTAAVADVDAYGNIRYKVVQIDADGVRVEQRYAIDKSVPTDYTQAAKQAINQGNIDAKNLPAKLAEIRVTADKMLRRTQYDGNIAKADDTMIDASTGKPIVETDAVPTLDQLPNKDTLVIWDRGNNEPVIEKLTARQIQVEALRERGVVSVMTDEGPKLGLYRAVDVDGAARKAWLIEPFGSAERMPNSITEPIVINEPPTMLVTGDRNASKPLRDALDFRDAQLAREAEEAADLASKPMVPEDLVPPNPVPGAPTTAGPSGAGLGGPPANVPGGGGVGGGGALPPGGGADGTPPGIPPPQPIGSPIYPGTPAWQRWSDALVKQVTDAIPKVLRDALISPVSASSALDLSLAASSIKGAGNMDIVGDRSAKAIQKATSPSFANMAPQQQAAVQKDITHFLTSKQADLTQFAQKYPEVYADIKIQVEDFKARVAANDQAIRNMGLIDPKTLPAPDGFKAVVKAVMDDEAYLAKGYMAHLLPPGEWAKMFQADTAKYGKVYSDAVDWYRKQKVHATKSDEAIERMVEDDLALIIKDPDAAYEKFMGRGSGRERVRERLAGTWDAAAKVLDAWSQANPAIARAAKRYVVGATDMLPAGINTKDAKFLQAAKREYSELMPQWLTESLGEARDPFTRMPLTITRQEEILARARGIEALAQSGRFMEISSVNEFTDIPPGWTMTTDDVSVWGKYASVDGQRWFVHPEAKDAVHFFTKDLDGLKKLVNEARVIQDKTAVGRALGKAYDIFRASKTSLSISAYWQNTFGLVRGLAMSGVMRPSDVIARRGDSWASVMDSYKQWRDFVDRPNKLSDATEKSGADWIREGIQYGTIGSDWMTHEHKAILRNMGKGMTAPGQASFFSRALEATARGNKVVGGAYAVPDQVVKHATWLAGLKRGGVDMKTGQLVDRDAAIQFVFGNGRNQRIMSRQQLSGWPDDKLLEMVKRASAQRVAQSFAMPDRSGKLGQVAGAVSTATSGLGANPFVRTAMEETRILAQLPARMMTQEGVAKSMLEYALVMGGLGAGINLLRKSNGVTKESEQQSFMGMPQGQRMYAPTAFAVGLKDKDGRHTLVDTGKLFDPFKWVGGNPYGLPAGVELEQTPGRLALRMASNATVYSVFGDDSPVGDMYKKFMADAGMLPADKQFTPAQPGVGAALQPLARYLAPGAITQGASAYADTQRGVSPEAALATFLSGGVLKTGGTPQEGAQNITKVQGQMKKELPQKVKPKDVGRKMEGMFNTVDKEDVRESQRRRIEQNKQNVQTTKQLRNPNR